MEHCKEKTRAICKVSGTTGPPEQNSPLPHPLSTVRYTEVRYRAHEACSQVCDDVIKAGDEEYHQEERKNRKDPIDNLGIALVAQSPRR
jgi:hypothetical protein